MYRVLGLIIHGGQWMRRAFGIHSRHHEIHVQWVIVGICRILEHVWRVTSWLYASFETLRCCCHGPGFGLTNINFESMGISYIPTWYRSIKFFEIICFPDSSLLLFLIFERGIPIIKYKCIISKCICLISSTFWYAENWISKDMMRWVYLSFDIFEWIWVIAPWSYFIWHSFQRQLKQNT